MPQHTVQLGDAMAALVTVLEALTYPTSAKKVFPGGARWVEEGEEIVEMERFPCALITVRGGQLDDENGLNTHDFNVGIEIRVARHIKSNAAPQLFGINRDGTDEPMGAGLIDTLVKLVVGCGTLTEQDNAKFLSYFRYEGFSAKRPTDSYSAWVVNFSACLNLA